jgi:HK97 family phage major capsid protein
VVSVRTPAVGSAQSLVGAGTDAAVRQLLGVPVLVSAAMTANTALVVDSTAVLSAYGQLQLAISQEAYFSSDSVGVRATWRFGQKIVDPARVVKLTVTP